MFFLVDLFTFGAILNEVFSLFVVCFWWNIQGIVATLYFLALASNNLAASNQDLQEVWNSTSPNIFKN
jgi:hypothetical protein